MIYALYFFASIGGIMLLATLCSVANELSWPSRSWRQQVEVRLRNLERKAAEVELEK